VPNLSGNLDFVPCLFTLAILWRFWPLRLPGITSICLIQLSCGTREIHALRSWSLWLVITTWPERPTRRPSNGGQDASSP